MKKIIILPLVLLICFIGGFCVADTNALAVKELAQGESVYITEEPEETKKTTAEDVGFVVEPSEETTAEPETEEVTTEAEKETTKKPKPETEPEKETETKTESTKTEKEEPATEPEAEESTEEPETEKLPATTEETTTEAEPEASVTETTEPETTLTEKETTAEPETEPQPVETEPEISVPKTDLALTRPDDIDPAKPMIALTFDDGPSAHTDRLLDIFKKNGGRGTFFVVGYMIEYRPATLKRIAAEGHEIGNHTWNHKQLTTLTENALKYEILMTQSRIHEITGVNTAIVRPPYGAFNDFVKSVGAELGVSFVNWSVDTLDWKTRNADAIYNEIMKSTQNGSIILCHDIHKTTVDAMETVIPRLIADGYQLVTVSELLSFTSNELVAGGVYRKQ